MKKMNKGKAYVIGLVSVVACYIVTLFFSKDAASAMSGPVVAGIVGITLSYIGGNVADNGVKGHFYNEGLSDKTVDKA
jgi:hypothetical protein